MLCPELCPTASGVPSKWAITQWLRGCFLRLKRRQDLRTTCDYHKNIWHAFAFILSLSLTSLQYHRQNAHGENRLTPRNEACSCGRAMWIVSIFPSRWPYLKLFNKYKLLEFVDSLLTKASASCMCCVCSLMANSYVPHHKEPSLRKNEEGISFIQVGGP